MRKQRWVWGIFFLLGAGVLIASKMGWIGYEIGTFTIIASIFLLAILIQSVVYVMIPGIVFSAAFLSMLYAQTLGITRLVPWTILGAALLLTIGLSLIFHNHGFHHHGRRWSQHHRGNWQRMESDDGVIEGEVADDSQTDISVRMGSAIRYVQAENVKQINIDAYMGNIKVYLDQAHIKDDQAEIYVDGELSGIELYVPRDWNVKMQNSIYLAGVDEKGLESTKQGPTVMIKGKLHLAGLTIVYI